MPVHKTLVPVLELWNEVLLHGEIAGEKLYIDDAPGVSLTLPAALAPFMLPPKEAYRRAFLNTRICFVKQTHMDILETMEAHADEARNWSIDDIKSCTARIDPDQLADYLRSVAQDVCDEQVSGLLSEREDEKSGSSPK